jgi:hypothetical protein
VDVLVVEPVPAPRLGRVADHRDVIDDRLLGEVGIGVLNSSSMGIPIPTVSPLLRERTVVSSRLALVMVWKLEVATVSPARLLTAVAVTA